MFEHHCIIELMGHQRIAGLVTEQEIGGQSFIRVDVPAVDGIPAFTKILSSNAIYSITPVDEATCLASVQRDRVRPIVIWGMQFNAPELEDKITIEPDDYDDFEEYEEL